MNAVTTRADRPSALGALNRPVLVFVGHFGCGKSEIAINLALAFAHLGERSSLVDLDVIKPYFRSRQAREELEASGIELVVPDGDRFWADLPIIVPRVRGIMSAPGGRVIVDVGGHDLGARALGSIADAVDVSRTELLFVVNTRRPFAEDQDGLRRVLADIEATGRLKVTGLVANTHLMEETTPEVVLAGLAAARELSAGIGVPLCFAAVLERLLRGNAGRSLADEMDCPVLPIERRLLPPEHLGKPAPRPGRPLGRPGGI
jgi:hypothetical protein